VFKTPKLLQSGCLYLLKTRQNAMNRLRRIWRNESGLTLLEMAIVLVVVGVFLAGVIPKGRAILDQARLKKTLMELHNHIMIVSEFLDKTNHAVEDGNSIWTQLQADGTLPPQVLQKDAESASPKLSNGGVLTIRVKDGRCSMILGKKGRGVQRSGFMTLAQARYLKKGLELKGVEVITDEEKVVQDTEAPGTEKNASTSADIYAIQIPVE